MLAQLGEAAPAVQPDHERLGAPNAEILDNAADGIFTLNAEGKVAYMNKAGAKMLGLAENEITGRRFVQLVGAEGNREWLVEIGRWLRHPESSDPHLLMDIPVTNIFGEKRWLGLHLQRQKANSTSGYGIQGVARDITEQFRLQQALRRSEEHYRGIIENMHLGILEVDNEERIVRAFPKFCEIVGYTEEELLGKKASEVLIIPEDRALMDARTEERNAGKSGLYEVPIRNKAGEQVWLLISGVPLFDEQGNVVGSMGIHYDISERKRDEFRLKTATEKAEAAQLAERAFLAKMSHEIRTPMNAILGMSHLLMQAELGKEEQEYVRAIEQGGVLLRGLLDDVLDLARLEEGRFELRKKSVHIKETFAAALSVYKLLLQDKGVQLGFEWDEELDVPLLMDKGVVSQILLNLIGNAAKFTEEGAVTVKAQLVRHEGKASMEVSVSDTGCGIPLEAQSEIFDKFRQLPSLTGGVKGGSGLGLAIVKELCAVHGGTVEVESEWGKGSLFRFRIEVGTTASSENKLEVKGATELSLGHVLVAEDNEVNILYLSRVLKSWNLEYTVVRNGREVLDYLQDQQTELILMDIQMPELTGIEATRAIRQMQGTLSEVPIIGLSAYAFHKDIEEGMDAGMNRYLKKPFSPDDLLRVLHEVLSPNL